MKDLGKYTIGFAVGVILLFSLRNCNPIKEYMVTERIDTCYLDTNTVVVSEVPEVSYVYDTIIEEKVKWKYDTVETEIVRYIDTAKSLQDYFLYKTYEHSIDTNDMELGIRMGIYMNNLEEFKFTARNTRPLIEKTIISKSREMMVGGKVMVGNDMGVGAGILYKDKKDNYFTVGAGYHNTPFIEAGVYKKF